MAYKLRSLLVGHEADIRCISRSIFPVDGILTASRDLSCRLWTCSGDVTNGFIESHVFQGHTRYVAAVCMMPPSELHPQGLVITGGHDNLILVFDFGTLEPISRLEGHTGSVCSLDAGKFGTILSGSWDSTARVWMNDKTLMTLQGHEAAVWCVKMIPDRGLMLTCSADKSIKLWKAGKCEHTYIGHTDCVRGLALLSNDEFLSCSNDGTVRRWQISGPCVRTYEGHTNFVYSIATIPGSNDSFVSSGEDRSVRVWKDDNCVQTITLPCISVWSVDALENGDIIVGSSDGVGRVFTCIEARQASPEIIQEFEEMVANLAVPASSSLDLGDIKVDQLPGPEALLRPGKKNDQTMLIKRNGMVEAHQWDDTNGTWQKVGEVTGAAQEEKPQGQSGKEVYEGKEYDHVFNVDIEEGKPPLKLPYNKNDDPWMAAQKFLERNEMSQMFLDQVANFIITNTESVVIGSVTTGYADPFTGAGRYIPGASASAQNVTATTNSTGSTSQASQQDKTYFPETTFLKFANAKCNQIISKLSEFNRDVQTEVKLTDGDMEMLSGFISKVLDVSPQAKDSYMRVVDCLTKMMQWPFEKCVPVLDTVRILVLDETVSHECVSRTDDLKVMEMLLQVFSKSDSISHVMLAFRILTNSFSHTEAANAIYFHRDRFLEFCDKFHSTGNKNLSIAVSSFLVNCSVYCYKANVGFEEKVSLCTCITKLLLIDGDSEALFRLLVALGTLIYGCKELVQFAASMDITNTFAVLSRRTDFPEKVSSCVLQLTKLLSS